MTLVLVGLSGVAVGFVGGVLFGRKNKKKVEAAVANLKERYPDVAPKLDEFARDIGIDK